MRRRRRRHSVRAILWSSAAWWSTTRNRIKSPRLPTRRRPTRRCGPQDTAARDKAESAVFRGDAAAAATGTVFRRRSPFWRKPRSGSPSSAQLELALGVAYYGMRRFDDAAGAFLRTISIAPEIDRPYLFLGRFLDQIPGRLPEVTKQFINYETANPASPTGYLLHAKALNVQAGDPEAACRHCSRKRSP